MTVTFYKYHGTGNDFILLDNRGGAIHLSTQEVAAMCHRHYGIGADGLMLLDYAEGYDFRMVYYNSDGNESSMCGNGGRCITAFARSLGIIADRARFMAIDGEHIATINENGTISLHMQDVKEMNIDGRQTVLNTGSPHCVLWVKDVSAVNVYDEGKQIRYQPKYQPGGINVNFVQTLHNKLLVRTYERGVEDETLSCGTGVTAAAIASTCNATGTYNILVNTPGGDLEVSFTKNTPLTATNVILKGPATFVFSGEWEMIK